MKVRFGFVLVLLTMSTLCYGQRYAVADGSWNSTSTWSTTEDGPPGASIPSANDDVYTDGRNVTIPVFYTSATCRNLYISYNETNGIAMSNGSRLTITGAMRGWNDLADDNASPINSVISFGSSAEIVMTGSNLSPSSPVIESWSASTTLRSVTFDFGVGNTFNASSDIQFSVLALLQSGSLVLDPSTTFLGSTADLAILSDATLEVGNDCNVGTFNTITVYGSLEASLSSVMDGGDVSIFGNLSSTGTLNVSGGLSNSGSLALGSVVFDGSSTQDISGNAFDLVNLTVASGATVTNNSNIDVTGTLTLQGTGSFDADGSGSGVLTLISSDNLTTARIAAIPGTATFSGDVTIQRFINGPATWRYLAMNVEGGMVSDWQEDDFPVTGNFTDPTSSTDPDVLSSTAPSIYYYDAINQEWVSVGSGGSTGSTALPENVGYSAWSYRSTDVTIDARGPIKQGNVTLPIGVTGAGWNLIPNPYPSQIDWDNITLPSGMGNAMYLRTANNVFSTYVQEGMVTDPPTANWTGEVAVGQSFWVSSQAPDHHDLVLTEAAKTFDEAPFVRKSEPVNYFKIALSSPTQRNETAFWFKEDATHGYDSKYDARKRRNGCETCPSSGYLNISSFTDDPQIDYAINSLPEIGCTPEKIGLRVRDVSPGSYSITFTHLDKLYLGYTIKLIDKFANTEMIAKNNNDKYDFAVTSDPLSYGATRFELEISAPIIETAESPVFTDLSECDDENVQVEIANVQQGILYQLMLGDIPVSDEVRSEGDEIVLSVPKSSIEFGSNVFTLKAETPGQCASHSFEETMNYSLDGITEIYSGQHCGEGEVTLSASATITDGVYKWYDDNEGSTLLQSSEMATFVTPLITKSKTYFVSVVDPNGCESPRVPVEASIVQVEKPVITADGMTLVSSSDTGNQWYKNGVLIEGATEPVLFVTETGQYSVQVKENGCENVSDTFSFVVTDLPEQLNDGVRLFPNPIERKLTVHIPSTLEPSIDGIAVYDTRGLEVKKTDSSAIHAGVLELDFSENDAGAYIFSLVCKDKVIAFRLLKK